MPYGLIVSIPAKQELPFTVVLLLFDFAGSSIEDVVLEHEDDIEQYRYVSQPQLDRIARDPRPVVLQARVDEELRNGQHAADEIHQYLIDAPSDRRFPSMVRPGLGDIFDDCDHELHVPNGIDLRKPIFSSQNLRRSRAKNRFLPPKVEEEGEDLACPYSPHQSTPTRSHHPLPLLLHLRRSRPPPPP